MSFFYASLKTERQQARPQTKSAIALLHKHECNACPLNRIPNLRHPKMKPHGALDAYVYFLGEAPGETEDRLGRPFVGKAGQTLRMRIPKGWDIERDVRMSNVVRTRPPNNRTPTTTEMECCRPSVVRDIEAVQPLAIFGFGAVPLEWAINQTGILKWRGRRIPIQVGNHTCWFFPMVHPSYVMRTRKFEPRSPQQYGSELEFAFALDLKNAFDAIEHLPDPIVHSAEQAFANIECIDGSAGNADVERLLELLRVAAKEPVAGVDYETTCLRPYDAKALILSAAVSTSKHTFAFAYKHREAKWSQIQLKRVEEGWATFLHDAPCRKISHQLAFELEWSGYFFGEGCIRATPWEDTVSQAYILDERMKMGKPDAHALEFLSIQYFGINLKAHNKINARTLADAPIADVLTYNGCDARYHRLLYHAQDERLRDEGLHKVYRAQIERVPTMVLTQIKGVPVHQPTVKRLQKKYNQILNECEIRIDETPEAKRFRQMKGHIYRPAADQDVTHMFHEILKIPIEKGDQNALNATGHPMAQLTLDWRKAAKLLSTYVEPLLPDSPHVFPDGLLHPVISTTRTRTWRTSSEDPNTQNYPKRATLQIGEHTIVSKEVRSQIKPRDDEVVVSFDYGQIQARNVAMESKDPALVKAFWDRYDIHGAWTERIVQLYPQWVKEGVKALSDKKIFKRYRDLTKNQLVFPSFFGAQGTTCAHYLGIPDNIGERLSEEFWDQFPNIKDWHKKIIKHYRKHGYVTGLTGFRRRAPISPNELINAPIQADESAIVCDAMTRLSKIDEDRLQASMEIHDDLTFIWHKKDVDRLAPIVIREMLSCPFSWINVPILVEMSIGPDWQNQEEVGSYESDNWDGTFKRKKDIIENPGSGSWADGTGWAGEAP